MVRHILQFVFLCGLVVIIQVISVQSDKQEEQPGIQFFFALARFQPFELIAGAYKATMVVSNPTGTNAKVLVKYFGLFSKPEFSKEIRAGETFTTTLPEELNLINAQKYTKSVYISASVNVSVQLLMDYSGHTRSSGGFTVLPKTSLTKKYIVATHCDDSNCTLLILSVENNDETQEVKVKLRINGTGRALYNGKKYSDGEEIKERGLGKGESMQVLCDQCDMTGTLVEGSRELAVFAGGEFTSLKKGTFKDMVIEQMMPLESIGQRYVLGFNLNTDITQLIKAVVLFSGKGFSYQGQNYTASRDREVFSFEWLGRGTVEISGDDRILIVQLLTSSRGQDFPDCIMNLPVPIFQWEKKYWTYIFPLQDSETVFVTVVSAGGAESVTIMGVVPVSRQIITESPYQLLTLQLDTSQLAEVTCTHADCQPFWAFVVYNLERRSWSSTLRTSSPKMFENRKQDEEKITSTSPPTTTAMTEPTIQDNENSLSSVHTKSQATSIEAALTTSTSSKDLRIGLTSFEPSTDDDTTTEIPNTSMNDLSSTSFPTAIMTLPASTNVVLAESLKTDPASEGSDVTVAEVNGATKPSQTSSPSSRERTRWCGCRCIKADTVANTTMKVNETLKTATNETIKKELTLDRKKLSSHIRKKRSAEDQRVSAQAVGTSLVIGVFAALFIMFIALDMIKLVSHLITFGRDQKLKPRISADKVIHSQMKPR